MVRAFGDGALLVDCRDLPEAQGLARALEALVGAGTTPWVGIEEVVVGFATVTVVVDPAAADLPALAPALARLPAGETAGEETTRRLEIPVVFDGPDREEAAGLAGTSWEEVLGLLAGTDLTVAFLGFAPGFAYLTGLPAPLDRVPRRRSPRPSVPAGSLGLAGGFAGIYPRASPAGWQLLGRSPFPLFDPTRPPYASLRAGDRVRLVPTGTVPVGDPPAPRPLLRSAAARTVEVVEPGILTTVQDAGRLGVARLGVPRAGAADPLARRLGNRLVGNAEGAALLEVTARGPTLRFGAPAHVALLGAARLSLEGLPVPGGSVLPVEAGQLLTVGTLERGGRAWLALGGGVEVEELLGSRSSDLLSGLGPGPLRAGDRLGLGPAPRPHGRLLTPGGLAGEVPGEVLLRLMAGPDPVDPSTLAGLLGGEWAVSPRSDRIGVRLEGGPPLPPEGPAPSRGMVTGAVQLPPEGRPIILGPDHGTVGGYPVVATVVTADLGRLGRCRPGDRLRFELVDGAGADAARRGLEEKLAGLVQGWYPVRTD